MHDVICDSSRKVETEQQTEQSSMKTEMNGVNGDENDGITE